MAGPWEDYAPAASPEAPAADGPWNDYKPQFGSDSYIKQMAIKHGVDEDTVRAITNSQGWAHAMQGVAGTFGMGSLVPKGSAAARAVMNTSNGATFAERYGKQNALQQEIVQDYEREHPIRSMAGELGGAALTGSGLVRAGAGPLIGAVEGGLGRQMVGGAAAGAGYSALDAELRGQEPGSSAATGAAVGALGPVAGRAVGAAIPGVRNFLRGGNPPTTPQNTFRVGSVDVPIDSGAASGLNTAGQAGGQDARNLATIQDLQAARRGLYGNESQLATSDFDRLTQQATEQAEDELRTSLDPNPSYAGQVRANDPYEAGTMARDAVQAAEQRQRANYQNLYNQALSQPGDIHRDAFTGIAGRIQQDLSNRANPVIIDNVTTPIAAHALTDLQNGLDQLRVQNRAAPGGQPDPAGIIGINLQGVDQARKRLIAMLTSAAPGTADRRAATAVIHAFDDQLEQSIRAGLFTGNTDQALNTLRQARQAYSTYANLFKSQVNDQGVGRAIQQITARNGYAGSSPTEIANMLYGQSKIGASPQSVRIAQRIRDIIGQDSHAWTAIKQGLFSKLIENPEGIANKGPKTVADRIFDFLNGSGTELAQMMFSPQERQGMQQYAQLMRQLQVPQAGANWSNTSTGMRLLVNHSLRNVMALLGEHMMGPLGVVGGLTAHAIGHSMGQRGAAGATNRALYMTPAQQQAEARLGEQLGRQTSMITQAIRAGIHPGAAVGGRQASDGNYYLPDPARPGKYLRVDDRRGQAAAG